MNKERLMRILQEPRVTEKSSILGDKYRQFVFRVLKDATKPEIKQAVETLFEVKVESVRTANTKGKVKRYQQALGQRSDWKKAYVRLQEGFDIDFMNVKGAE